MKKILFILLISVFNFSCSKDDDSNDQPSSFINPPDWIIGTWMDESEPEALQTGGFQFTHDNILLILSNGEVFLNLKEGLQDTVNTGSTTTNETISETAYTWESQTNGIVTARYTYRKGPDSTTIIYELTTSIDVVLTKQ